MIRLFSALIITILITSCKQKDDQRLNAFVSAELKKGTDTLYLSHFSDVVWNRMYIVPPYSSYRSYDKILMKYRDKIDRYNIQLRDDISIILLFHSDNLVYKTTFNGHYKFEDAVKLKNNILVSYAKNKANLIYMRKDKWYFFRQDTLKRGWTFFNPLEVNSSSKQYN